MNPNPKSTSPVASRFFDGRTARAFPARLWFLPGPRLVVQTPGFEAGFGIDEIHLPAPVGNTPRFIHLPGGQTCEVSDLPALEAALAAWPPARTVRRRAPGWRFALGSVAFLLAAIWLIVSQGLPFAARQASFALPQETVLKLGESTLAELDHSLFHPSGLPQARINQLLHKSRRFFTDVGEPPDRRIEFRSAPTIGPNAMALPNGVIVFTDDIVRLAENDEQLLAVLAHECGHIHHRHSLRGLLQRSVVLMAATLVSGNHRSLDSAQAALTSHLVNSRYSRDFEFEADAYAAELLRRAGIPETRLGEMLDLLERHAGRAGAKESPLESYLHSHPATSERKTRLEKQ